MIMTFINGILRIFFFSPLMLVTACGGDSENDVFNESIEVANFYYGADLSYVNEMEDCGALYLDQNGKQKDPYLIFADAGANLIRLRLWHNPDWTNYSTYSDMKKSISRAKALGVKVLLDFHYSDDWADPGKQQIPKAWIDVIDNSSLLGDSVYNYTYQTLNNLNKEGLLPDIVQIGNEINGMILQDGELQWPINWLRNSILINRGIKAVRDISSHTGKEVEVMLHIAQPENGLWWFEQATENHITDFDWIGLSYYPIWSEYTLDNVEFPLKNLVNNYGKKLMIVETAYPFTLLDVDAAGNILNGSALVEGYPASAQGQLNYLNALSDVVKSAGGSGVIYWEPAWVSTSCQTQWGAGSHWDNATLFDHNRKASVAMDFYNGSLKED